jgi:hypothetical protein
MRKLRSTPGIRLFNFTQADAYTRRFPYLDKLELPMGIFDLGKNNPPETVFLIGPTVELVAREGLHPALSDLLIEAAREVHGGAGMMRRAGEFPAPLEQDFRISDDASRYYKSKGIPYRNLLFWLATLTDRLLVLIVPILVLLIPGFRVVPWLHLAREIAYLPLVRRSDRARAQRARQRRPARTRQAAQAAGRSRDGGQQHKDAAGVCRRVLYIA